MTDTATMEQRVDLIKMQPIFSKLTEKEKLELAALFSEKHCQAGEIVVKQGQPVDSVFIIVSGDADVRVATVDNGQLHENSVATLKPTQAIGLSETGFYSLSGRRTATVIAHTDMTLLMLSVASFNGFALANSHVGDVMRRNAPNVVEPE